MTTREFDGVFVDLAGRGTPIVVVPGGPARHPEYLEHLGGLDQRGYQVITLYPRGIGPSPIPEDVRDYAASRQADGIETVRQHLGLETIPLVAHSAGSAVALNYAAAHPDRLDSLVLVTPSPRVVGLMDSEDEWESQLAKQAHQPWYPDARRALDEIEQHGPSPERRAAMLPLLYGAWDDRAQSHAARDPHQSTPDARRHFFDDEPDPVSVREAMGRVTCPVRILVGEVDPGPGPQLAAEFAALFSDARVDVIPGAGHFGWVTDPDGFAAAMESALTS